jgi:hypothetical protein
MFYILYQTIAINDKITKTLSPVSIGKHLQHLSSSSQPFEARPAGALY